MFFNIFKRKKKDKFQLEKFLLETNFSTETISELRKYFYLDKDAFTKRLLDLIDIPDYTVLKFETKPAVILMLGVNGVGKTTSSAKLAYLYTKSFYKVKLVGADTFRAGAREQLRTLASKVPCDYYTDENTRDAGAIAYRSIDLAIEDGTDVIIIDTGGRLHNKQALMAELEKLLNVVERKLARKIDQKILVLDATQGQSVKKQVEIFGELTNFDGVLLSKFDSFKNLGVIFTLNSLKIPVFFVGLGEKLKDLSSFSKDLIRDNL